MCVSISRWEVGEWRPKISWPRELFHHHKCYRYKGSGMSKRGAPEPPQEKGTLAPFPWASPKTHLLNESPQVSVSYLSGTDSNPSTLGCMARHGGQEPAVKATAGPADPSSAPKAHNASGPCTHRLPALHCSLRVVGSGGKGWGCNTWLRIGPLVSYHVTCHHRTGENYNPDMLFDGGKSTNCPQLS